MVRLLLKSETLCCVGRWCFKYYICLESWRFCVVTVMLRVMAASALMVSFPVIVLGILMLAFTSTQFLVPRFCYIKSQSIRAYGICSGSPFVLFKPSRET